MQLLKTILLMFMGSFLVLESTVIQAANVHGDECASIKNSFEQISCYFNLAKKLNDLTVCDKASHEGVRYQCYALFAEYSKSSEICHKIPRVTKEHLSLIDICLSGVAFKASNPEICENINNSGLRDSCFFKLAKKSGDLTLCEKILDSGLKSGCSGQPVIVE
jgi:hypothetical protein